MILSPPDRQLVLQLLGGLDRYLNRHLRVLDLPDDFESTRLSPEQLAPLRTRLFESPEWIAAYHQENPDRLGGRALELVGSWRGFIRASFLVHRYLRKGAILGGGKPYRFYCVQGLTQPLQDLLCGQCPACIQTTLLPFEDRITYDGFLSLSNVHFGGGARRHAAEDYALARRRGEIIHSLGREPQPPRPRQLPHATDFGPVLRSILDATEKLRGGSSPAQSAAFSLIRAAAQLASLSSSDPDVGAVRQQLTQARRSITRMETALYETSCA